MSRGKFVVGSVVLGLLVMILLWSPAFAQEIEISRPLDGATVRETVKIMVPAASILMDGFVAYAIDERFRCAVTTESEDDEHFVYAWNTKADNPDPDLTPEQRRARDGKHTITVQAYDAAGKSYGESKTISVYVKNNISPEMPPEGLKLRYTQTVGSENKYKFKYTMDLKSIQGGTDVAASAGEAIEGAEGTIKRTVEDKLPDGTMLVRQKLMDTLKFYQGGRAVPALWLATKAGYQIEDSMGRVTSMIASTSPGASVTVDLPAVPAGRVRIGDTWTQTVKLLKDVVSGQSVRLEGINTLEGLEWEGGYPCAKIRTTFSGTARIPQSRIFLYPVPLTGEMITYFAYEVGKVISCTTTGTIEARVPPNWLSSLTQSRLPQNIGSYAPGASTYSTGDTMPGMPAPAETGPWEETPYPGYAPATTPTPAPGYPGTPSVMPGLPGSTPGTGMMAEQIVSVTFEFNQRVELVR